MADQHQFCTFLLDGYHFGIDVLRVQELAAGKENVAAAEVLLHAPDGEPEPDEFLIVSQLRSGELEHESG